MRLLMLVFGVGLMLLTVPLFAADAVEGINYSEMQQDMISIGTYGGLLSAVILLTSYIFNVLDTYSVGLHDILKPGICMLLMFIAGGGLKLAGMYPESSWVDHIGQLIVFGLSAIGTHAIVRTVSKPSGVS